MRQRELFQGHLVQGLQLFERRVTLETLALSGGSVRMKNESYEKG
jgi:hypothetical protein